MTVVINGYLLFFFKHMLAYGSLQDSDAIYKFLKQLGNILIWILQLIQIVKNRIEEAFGVGVFKGICTHHIFYMYIQCGKDNLPKKEFL